MIESGVLAHHLQAIYTFVYRNQNRDTQLRARDHRGRMRTFTYGRMISRGDVGRYCADANTGYQRRLRDLYDLGLVDCVGTKQDPVTGRTVCGFRTSARHRPLRSRDTRLAPRVALNQAIRHMLLIQEACDEVGDGVRLPMNVMEFARDISAQLQWAIEHGTMRQPDPPDQSSNGRQHNARR